MNNKGRGKHAETNITIICKETNQKLPYWVVLAFCLSHSSPLTLHVLHSLTFCTLKFISPISIVMNTDFCFFGSEYGQSKKTHTNCKVLFAGYILNRKVDINARLRTENLI